LSLSSLIKRLIKPFRASILDDEKSNKVYNFAAKPVCILFSKPRIFGFGITGDVVITVYLLHFYLQLRLYSKRNMVYGTLCVPELTIPHLTVRLLYSLHGQPYARVDFIPQSGTKNLASELVFVDLLRRPGIDSQPGGPTTLFLVPARQVT
jgi:hypothetical protein